MPWWPRASTAWPRSARPSSSGSNKAWPPPPSICAKEAIREAQLESIKAAGDLRKAAGEARREAWRWFGGFWVWLVSAVLTGALLALLTAFWIVESGNAREFGKYPGIFCDRAGGTIVTNADGYRFCGIWIDKLPEK